MELPKAYNPKEHEERIYQMWLESGYFTPENLPEANRRKPFTIIMPPPNVTGTLHAGHAMFVTIQDIFTRFYRMLGRRALWLPGTDHAAIATQAKVEKILYEKEKKTRYDLGREEFLRRVEEFARTSQSTILGQLKKMGSSCDWSRLAYTLDEKRSHAVATAFKRMYDAGLIYRGKRIVNWDPKMQTTVSDDEIEWKEETAPLYYLKYGPFTIATARPETKFGDKYVVMHPADKRYAKYKHGDKLEAEWINGPVTATIIKDEIIDMEFGTGCMTITPAHDTTDFEIANRHKLDIEQIIDEQGKLLPIAGEFAGLHIKKGRLLIVEKLEQKGLIEKIDEQYAHRIATNSRGGGVIEPQIKEQWFIAVNSKFQNPNSKINGIESGQTVTLKQLMRQVVDSGQIKIIPDRFVKIYFHWIDNLRDWCISRQIWFGHRIPVWYCRKSENQELPVMGFDEDVVPQVLGGKTKTYRLRDHNFQIGDRVAFRNSQTGQIFGYGVISDVQRTTVGEIPLDDSTHFATYNSRQELLDAFKRRNPQREVSEKTIAFVYTYAFEPVRHGEGQGCGQIVVGIPKRATILAVRHGESEHNVKHVINGDPTKLYHLTEKGKKQADEIAKKLSSRQIDAIIVSQMLRTQETAAELSQKTGVPVQTDARLNDVRTGELEGTDIGEFRKLTNELQQSIQGSETINEVANRLQRLLRDVAEQYNGKVVVLVSSEMILHCLQLLTIGQQCDERCGHHVENGEIEEFTIQAPVSCPSCGAERLAQDPDTLDTWFSSGLWTFSTLGWPCFADASQGKPDDSCNDLQTYHPTQILETAYEILFFWVARMILMSIYLLGEIPFETVYLHGLVRDEKREKLSKSKGDSADPLDLIESYGTDALRFALIFNTSPGTDSVLSEEKIKGMKHFANKLWNISRFVLTNLEGIGYRVQGSGEDTTPYPLNPTPLTNADREILAKLDQTVKEVTSDLENYRIHEAAQSIYQFTWYEFADVYLEASKKQLQDSRLRDATLCTLHFALCTILKLLHPFMPFITETIWQQFPGNKKPLLMIEKWPI